MNYDSDPTYKICSKCNTIWKTRSDYLADPEIRLVGYQVNFKELELGLFLFNHACMTTMALEANLFSDLFDGPVFTERRTGCEECPGYCLRRSELRSCPTHCECAWIREVLQVIMEWQKVKVLPG